MLEAAIDSIEIALDIAKDEGSVKSDIKRVDEFILNNKDAQLREHHALLELSNIIQDKVHKIERESRDIRRENNLSIRVQTQEQRFIKEQNDIETLFKSMSNLESTCASNNKFNLMEIENNESILNENCVVLSNLPDRERIIGTESKVKGLEM